MGLVVSKAFNFFGEVTCIAYTPSFLSGGIHIILKVTIKFLPQYGASFLTDGVSARRYLNIQSLKDLVAPMLYLKVVVFKGLMACAVF